MSRKQTRPLLILKSENDDFPFDIKDVNLNNIKQIDYFRMYNSLKMVLEKLIEEQVQLMQYNQYIIFITLINYTNCNSIKLIQPLQQKLQTNIDFAFQVFLQKDQTSTQQQKGGKRNQSQPFLKKEMVQLVEILSQMGYSDKQIQERLQLNPGQTSNGINQHSEIQEGDQQSGKKQTKEKQKQGQVIDKQKLYYEQQFHLNDEPEQN